MRKILLFSACVFATVKPLAGALQPLLRLQHDADVLYAEFSPNGKRIVTASEDKTARGWDAPP
jgi:WD40 repeat protein